MIKKYKTITILIIILFSLSLSNADELEKDLVNQLVNLEDMTIYTNTNFNIKLVPTGSDPVLKKLEINKTFVPLVSDRQTILNQNIFPANIEYEKSPTNILYKIYGLDDREFKIGQESTIKTKFIRPKITKKITLPINIKDEQLKQYISPSENIDSNNVGIRQKAKEIVGDEDDMYIAVSSIATWVETNINYSLNSLTEKVTQKSSWVLNNRFGVCDELTSLFIAMLRSQGIPAKYVSGMAYTNFNDLNDWGPHAWAEVYFPEVGWVPYDITYHEFGFLDASHIKFRESHDSSTKASEFKWINNNVDIEIEPIQIEINSIDAGNIKKDNVVVNANLLDENIGLDSYNLIEVEIENQNNFYLTYDIYLTLSDVMDLVDGNHKSIILEPNQKKKLYFRIKHKKELEKGFSYTIPFIVYNQLEDKNKLVINSKEIYRNIEKEEIETKFDFKIKSNEIKNENDLYITCESDETSILINKNLTISCDINFESKKNLELCIEDKCEFLKEEELNIKKIERKINFVNENPGNKYISIYLKRNNELISDSLNINVRAIPKLKIENIEYADDVNTLQFEINKLNDANPKNAIIEVYNKNFLSRPLNTWKLDEIKHSQEFKLHLNGNELMHGPNQIEVNVLFEFENNSYSLENSELISLKKGYVERSIDFILWMFNKIAP